MSTAIKFDAVQIIGAMDRFAAVDLERTKEQGTILGFNYGNSPKITDWRESRPHWMAFGDGTQLTEVVVNEDGSLNFYCHEHAEGKRQGKETWGNLTVAGATALMQLLQQKLSGVK